MSNDEDLELTSNGDNPKTWKALAGSGKVYRDYKTPYLKLTVVLKSQDTPIITEATLQIANAAEVLASLSIPGQEPTPLAVSNPWQWTDAYHFNGV